MVYYVIKNEDGFEELVFEGSMEEARSEKMRLELHLTLSKEAQHPGSSRVKYYVFPETEWRMETGVMH